MDTFYLSLTFGGAAACANMLGGLLLAAKKEWDRVFLTHCVAVGAGFLLAASFLEMIPESLNLTPHAPLLFLAGYLLIHFFERTLAAHFHFGEETHAEVALRPSVPLFASLGMLIHAFFDGVSIASGFQVGTRLGLLIFLAVFLHKVPEGFTIASIMIAWKKSRGTAFISSTFLALSTTVGVFTATYAVGILGYSLALSAGVMVYVAASDLIPEVTREKGMGVALAVFVGVILFYATTHLLKMTGLEGQ